ncbi:hypothetical protein N7454_007352 [Penicillium verhagenii]|nr:hypothetical protein N7454_007352 [Penicillium verhagenii]
MPTIEEILNAAHVLATLRLINVQELLPHRDKLEDALRVLQEQVDAARAIQLPTAIPRNPPDDHNPSSYSTSPAEGNPHADSNSQQSNSRAESNPPLCCKPIDQLFEALSREKETILSSLRGPEYDFLNGWFDEDPRIIDISLTTPTSNPEGKLRRGLSQRSLAKEYDQWEREKFKTSRLDEISEDPKRSCKSRRSGHISDFVKAHQFKDENTAMHGIKHGLRLLVFESIYGVAGISAILIFLYGSFRSVNYSFS